MEDPTPPVKKCNSRPEDMKNPCEKRKSKVNSKNRMKQRKISSQPDVCETVTIYKGRCCCVCGDKKATLRCPLCNYKYCNLSCYNLHKISEICTKDERKTTLPAETKQLCYENPSTNTVPPTKLKRLSDGNNRRKMRQLLTNERIRNSVMRLNTTSTPVEEFRSVMMEETFVEFSDFILNVFKD